MFRFVGDPVASILGTGSDADRPRPNWLNPWGRTIRDRPVRTLFRNAQCSDFGIFLSSGSPGGGDAGRAPPADGGTGGISALVALVLGVPPASTTPRSTEGAGLDRQSHHEPVADRRLAADLPDRHRHDLLFGVKLRWLPRPSGAAKSSPRWWTTGLLTVSGLKSLIMPVITLAFFQLTTADHAAGARRDARGDAHRQRQVRPRTRLDESSINYRHALKNTMMPVVTITGLQLGSVIAFAI